MRNALTEIVASRAISIVSENLNSDLRIVFSHVSSGYKHIIWSRKELSRSTQLLLVSPIIPSSSPFMQYEKHVWILGYLFKKLIKG